MNSNLEYEIQSVEELLSNIENINIRKRVTQVVIWNIKKATKYKRLYYWMSIAIIILTASIPVINLLDFLNPKISTSIISALAGILASILTLVNVKETWLRYRKYAEMIKSESVLFINKCERYSEIDAECKFIENIESIIGEERLNWEEIRKKSHQNKSNE